MPIWLSPTGPKPTSSMFGLQLERSQRARRVLPVHDLARARRRGARAARAATDARATQRRPQGPVHCIVRSRRGMVQTVPPCCVYRRRPLLHEARSHRFHGRARQNTKSRLICSSSSASNCIRSSSVISSNTRRWKLPGWGEPARPRRDRGARHGKNEATIGGSQIGRIPLPPGRKIFDHSYPFQDVGAHERCTRRCTRKNRDPAGLGGNRQELRSPESLALTWHQRLLSVC